MSLQKFCAALASIFCFTLIACSSLQPTSLQTADSTSTNIDTPFKTFAWDTPVAPPHGKVVIIYQLPQYARAEIFLLKQKESHKSTALAAIKLLNENCLKGHQPALGYRTSNGEFYTKYFTKELDWAEHNTISVRWVNGKSIEITTNNETLSVPVTESGRVLQVISYEAPIEIQQVQYFSEQY